MADFVKLAATAQRLVEANGRAVDLFRVNRTPDDPARPWRGVSGSPTVPEGGFIATGIIMAFVPPSGSGFGKLLVDGDGELDVAFDQIGLLASDSLPVGITPEDIEQADSIRDGSDIWKIMLRSHLRPASTSLLFTLGLKR